MWIRDRFMRKPIGSSIAAILMVTIMLPFFFMAMYEKDGLPTTAASEKKINCRFVRFNATFVLRCV